MIWLPLVIPINEFSPASLLNPSMTFNLLIEFEMPLVGYDLFYWQQSWSQYLTVRYRLFNPPDIDDSAYLVLRFGGRWCGGSHRSLRSAQSAQ